MNFETWWENLQPKEGDVVDHICSVRRASLLEWTPNFDCGDATCKYFGIVKANKTSRIWIGCSCGARLIPLTAHVEELYLKRLR